MIIHFSLLDGAWEPDDEEHKHPEKGDSDYDSGYNSGTGAAGDCNSEESGSGGTFWDNSKKHKEGYISKPKISEANPDTQGKKGED